MRREQSGRGNRAGFVFTIRLTEEDFALLRRGAELAGVRGVSTFLRRVALGRARELFEARVAELRGSTRPG